MAIDYSRIHRLLKIFNLIQGEKGWNAARLSRECGTTRRTIFRDISTIVSAGIPVFFNKAENGFTIGRDFFMRPVELTFEESLALLALGKHIGGKEQIPFTRGGMTAMAKIRSQLPPKVQDELNRLDDRIAVKLSQHSPPEESQDVYTKMRRALATHRCVRCRYESQKPDAVKAASGGTDEFFIFKPYTLLFSQRAWYVVGYHTRRDEVRTLKLTRFSAVELTDLPYDIPARFSLDAHLGNAWRMIRGKQTHHVVLRFDPAFADTIAETHWHKTQTMEHEEDGSLKFTCDVDGLEEIVWWILSMGSHCRVIEPAELRERVRTEAQQMVKLYAK